MRETFVTRQRIENPIDIGRSVSEFGVGDLGIGESLSVIAPDYDVRVTRRDPEAEDVGAPSIQQVYQPLGNLFVQGSIDSVKSDDSDVHTKIEWFTSLSQLNRAFIEHQINPHAFGLDSAPSQKDYAGNKRVDRIAEGRLLVPGSAEGLVEARTDGELAGALLASELVKEEIVGAASVRANGQKKRYIAENLSSVLRSIGLAISSHHLEGFDEASEENVEDAFREELAVGDLHRVGDLFAGDGGHFIGGMQKVVSDLTVELVSMESRLVVAQQSYPSIEELRAQLPAA